MLRLFLPPNLAAAAPRDAIAVRVELAPEGVPPAELLPALVMLQRWCASPTPPKLIQLTRARLRELVAALHGQPVFFWVNGPTAPIGWQGDALAGVSVFLSPPVTAAKPAAPSLSSSPSPRKNPAAADSTPLVVDGSEHFLAITLPSRERSNYASALALVKDNGFILEPANRKWWLRDRHKVLNFLAAHGTRLRESFGAEFTANFAKNTINFRPTEVVSEATETGDTYAVTLALRAGSAADAQVREAVAANRGYLEADGKVFLLDQAQLSRFAEAQRLLAGEPGANLATRRTHRVSGARVVEAQEILEQLSPGFQPPETWRARSDALRNLSTLAFPPLPPALAAQLRPYQRLGVAWLWHLYRHELAGILADEMGLGKTLQALGLLSCVTAARIPPGAPSARDRGERRVRDDPSFPSLVVAPASLLENWRREAARFAPQLRTFVHHGEDRLTSAADFAQADLVVTSYGTLARDQELFTQREFACVIADEAQHIKNRRSQNAAALRALRARGRFLLTGTPLENSLDDLRSLFEFLLPGYLDRVPPGLRAEERAWFDQRLRAKTAPYILRRTKQSVAPELPEKLEQIIWCEMTPSQAALYRSTQEKSERDLLDLAAGGASENHLRFAALTQLLRLRQIACDPRLVEAGRVTPQAPLEAGEPERRLRDNSPYLDSAKLDAFRELLEEAVDDGHRVLVFSQFTSLLALLREELEAQGLGYCYLDGSMPARARQAEVDRFQASPDVPVFFLSLKAGGTGLNLTGADTVVHFDPWWNPAAEAQATDRAHRIGQTRVVTSYKLIASGTVEEKVLALQTAKRALLADVFEASDAAAARLSLADLKSLLSG